MRPYTDSNGKAKSQLFWGDKLAKKYRKYFKKSARVKDIKYEDEIIDLNDSSEADKPK